MSEPPWELTDREEHVPDPAGGPGWRFVLRALSGFERNAALADAHARAVDPRRRVERSPMFGVVWASGRALAHVVARDEGIPGADVLELACGLALPSLVAAARGARVLATDNHPSAPGFLDVNRVRAGVSLRYADVDLRDPPDLHPGRFDRVIASDLLFAHDMPALVASAFARWLVPDGVGWLVDPGRAWLPELETACRAVRLEVDVDAVDGDGVELYLCRIRHHVGVV